MTDDIPFDKTFDLVPDQPKEVAPGVRAVVANNPGPFTFKGTMSYIIGRGKVAIVDPGPDDDAHVAALLDAVRGETVTHIFVTHTHRDHSPAVPKIKAATGATVFAEGPHRPSRPLHIGDTRRLDASADMDFRPDTALKDGDTVAGDGWTIEAVTTPGHTANHMAFALQGRRPVVRRRSRDGVVDHDRGAARRRHERLHGVAAKTRAPPRADLPARPRRAGARGARASSQFLIRAPARPRGLDPASARQGRGRHADHRQGGLYRARSAPRPAPPGFQHWRILKIWWRAAWSRPTARRRSTAPIA